MGKGFDQYASQYDAWFLENRNVLYSEVNLVASVLRDAGRILSVGCGSGLFEKILREESDIDIAIKTKPNILKNELYELSNLLADELKRDIDLVNLDTIENDGFKYEILINGKVIYCDDSYKFDLYKLDAYREYLELNEARKQIIDEMKK